MPALLRPCLCDEFLTGGSLDVKVLGGVMVRYLLASVDHINVIVARHIGCSLMNIGIVKYLIISIAVHGESLTCHLLELLLDVGAARHYKLLLLLLCTRVRCLILALLEEGTG